MSLLLSGVLLVAIMMVSTGCSSVNISADVAPNADLAGLKTFYVVIGPDVDEDVGGLISEKLVAMGRESTAGRDAKPPTDVDAIVTYMDRWMWDITMYMLELTVEISSGEDGSIIASGHSYRTSLARKSPEHMVGEVLDEIFSPKEEDTD